MSCCETGLRQKNLWMDLGKYAEHSKQPWTVLFPANPKKSPRGEIVPFGASVDDGKGRVPECVLFLEALGLQIRPGHSNARRTSELNPPNLTLLACTLHPSTGPSEGLRGQLAGQPPKRLTAPCHLTPPLRKPWGCSTAQPTAATCLRRRTEMKWLNIVHTSNVVDVEYPR
jgi:hypothetical protein